MKKILCIALALMLVLSLAACGGAGGSGVGGSNEVGKYYLQSMEAEGMSIGREFFTAMGMTEEQLDEYMFIEITAPGKATVTMEGETINMEYDATSMWPVDEPDEKANCTVADGKITLEIEGSKVIFAKK